MTYKHVILALVMLFPVNWLCPETYQQYDQKLDQALNITRTAQTQTSLKSALNSAIRKNRTTCPKCPINVPTVAKTSTVVVYKPQPFVSNGQQMYTNDYNLCRIVSAMIVVESQGNRMARGRSGERGLLQITKAVWLEYSEYPWEYAYNSRLNIECGTAYLTWLVNKYGLENGIRRYNCGKYYRSKKASRYYQRVMKEVQND